MKWIWSVALAVMCVSMPALAADSAAVLVYDGDDVAGTANLQVEIHSQFGDALPNVRLLSIRKLGARFGQLTSANTAEDQIPFDDLLKGVGDLVFDGDFKKALATLAELEAQTGLAKDPPARRIAIELWRIEIQLAQKKNAEARAAVDAALALDAKLVVDLGTFTPDVAKAISQGRARIPADTELTLDGLLPNALVWIDGERAGTSPFKVTPGAHWVEIQLHGFHSVKRWVSTPSASINMAVKLPPSVGTLVRQAVEPNPEAEKSTAGLERVRQRLKVSTLVLVRSQSAGNIRAAVYPETQNAPRRGSFANTQELIAWAVTAVPESASAAPPDSVATTGPAPSWTPSLVVSAGVAWWVIQMSDDGSTLFDTYGAGPGAEIQVGLDRAAWHFDFSGGVTSFFLSTVTANCVANPGCAEEGSGGTNLRLQLGAERRFGERFFVAPRAGVLLHAFEWNDLSRTNGDDLGVLGSLYVVAPEVGATLGHRRGDFVFRGMLMGRLSAVLKDTIYGDETVAVGPGAGAGVSVDWMLSRWILSASGRVDWHSVGFSGQANYNGTSNNISDVNVSFIEPAFALGVRREF